MEIFKDIPWHEWLYQISNLWIVKSLWNNLKRKEKILKIQYKKSWYWRVNLFTFWWQRKWLVHRLVMLAFVWYSELEVNHINHNPSDNRLENLEYVSKIENLQKRRPYWIICCPHCNKTFKYRKTPTP